MWSITQAKDIKQGGGPASDDERIVRENNWVRGINRGDEKAFEAMYKYYYPRLGQFLMRYVHSKKIAEDLIQNLFYNIWKNRTRLEPRGTLRAYLYTGIRNQAFKYLNKEKNRNHTDISKYPHLQEEPPFQEGNLEFKEFRKAVQEAVKQLPERRRHIFLLHREDKLTYREIAEVLDISIKTVETQMSRSIKFLSEKLAHFKY